MKRFPVGVARHVIGRRQALAFVTAAVAVLVFSGAGASAPAPVDLGTLGGDLSVPEAVNDSGQVVGFSRVANGDLHPFSWTRAGGMVDLGTLGGTGLPSLAAGVSDSGLVAGNSFTASGAAHAFVWTQSAGMADIGGLGGNQTQVYAVGASGQVVGESYAPDGNMHAFSWTQAGGMVDLGTLNGPPPSPFSIATAVSPISGQVVGFGMTGGIDHAFSWTRAGGMVDLGVLGGDPSRVNGVFSRANAVNDSGEVVGESTTATGDDHAFSWTRSGGMVDLGTLGGTTSQANAVNNSGEVVGYSMTADGGYHAFAWTQAGGMVDLGANFGGNSYANAINDSGEVVGVVVWSNGSNETPFLWTQTGGMVDLGTLGGRQSGAVAVNDSGDIVGDSYTAVIDGSDEQHAVLWQAPSDTTPPSAAPAQSPAANSGGWNSSDVTVIWNWTDAGGSGIDPNNCTQSSTSTGEGTITLSATCTDGAGNTGTASYKVKVDKTAPTDNPVITPAANGAGWNNTDVTVAWNWADSGSGVDAASCTQSSTTSGEGTAVTVDSTCTDLAGNAATDSRVFEVDETAPIVNYTGGGSYTLDQTVTVTCLATDALSGVASTSCANVSSPAWQLGLGIHQLSATATDEAGNTGSGFTSYTITVTATSLCDLVTAWAKNAGQANSLCVKLEAATAAAARGQTKTHDNNISAFDNEVTAQTGKSFTAAQAALLTKFAAAL